MFSYEGHEGKQVLSFSFHGCMQLVVLSGAHEIRCVFLCPLRVLRTFCCLFVFRGKGGDSIFGRGFIYISLSLSLLFRSLLLLDSSIFSQAKGRCSCFDASFAADNEDRLLR